MKALENFVLSQADKHLRYMAGYFSFCFMACCRHADPMYAVNWSLSCSGSVVLVEAGTRFHKRQGQLLEPTATDCIGSHVQDGQVLRRRMNEAPR